MIKDLQKNIHLSFAEDLGEWINEWMNKWRINEIFINE